MKTDRLYSLENSIAGEFLSGYEFPWQSLKDIKNFICMLGKTLDRDEYEQVKDDVWIAKNAKVYPSVYIEGPCIIDKNAEIRHCAFIRGNALIGKGSVVGNSTEVKNSIVFDNVQIPHYNYVGDSILGYKSHLGAGSITSNIKSDKTDISIKTENGKIETGLRKFGAMIGDYSEIGCNCVLFPGTVIGKNCTVYPLTRVRGYIRENSIVKSESAVVIKK